MSLLLLFILIVVVLVICTMSRQTIIMIMMKTVKRWSSDDAGVQSSGNLYTALHCTLLHHTTHCTLHTDAHCTQHTASHCTLYTAHCTQAAAHQVVSGTQGRFRTIRGLSSAALCSVVLPCAVSAVRIEPSQFETEAERAERIIHAGWETNWFDISGRNQRR